jgi:hypothetical protein
MPESPEKPAKKSALESQASQSIKENQSKPEHFCESAAKKAENPTVRAKYEEMEKKARECVARIQIWEKSVRVKAGVDPIEVMLCYERYLEAVLEMKDVYERKAILEARDSKEDIPFESLPAYINRMYEMRRALQPNSYASFADWLNAGHDTSWKEFFNIESDKPKVQPEPEKTEPEQAQNESPFQPREQEVYDVLKGRLLTRGEILNELGKCGQFDQSLDDILSPRARLRSQGHIKLHESGRGYWRPDAPPPKEKPQ